jgi:hypothetical protein
LSESLDAAPYPAVGSAAQHAERPLRERISDFLSGIKHSPKSRLAVHAAIVPLPMPSRDRLLEKQLEPTAHDKNGELLRNALLNLASRDSSWMRVPGGRGYDSGHYCVEQNIRLSFTEYFAPSGDGTRRQCVRLYEGLNAIVATEVFRENEAFSPTWIWMVVRPAASVAQAVLRVLSPKTNHACVAVVLNNVTTPLRLVNAFGSKDYALRAPSNKKLTLGDPPFRLSFDRPEAVESVVRGLRRELYDRFAVGATE